MGVTHLCIYATKRWSTELDLLATCILDYTSLGFDRWQVSLNWTFRPRLGSSLEWNVQFKDIFHLSNPRLVQSNIQITKRSSSVDLFLI